MKNSNKKYSFQYSCLKEYPISNFFKEFVKKELDLDLEKICSSKFHHFFNKIVAKNNYVKHNLKASKEIQLVGSIEIFVRNCILISSYRNINLKINKLYYHTVLRLFKFVIKDHMDDYYQILTKKRLDFHLIMYIFDFLSVRKNIILN